MPPNADLNGLQMAVQVQAAQTLELAKRIEERLEARDTASAARDELLAQIKVDMDQVKSEVASQRKDVAEMRQAFVQAQGAMKMGKFIVLAIGFLGLVGVRFLIDIAHGVTK